MNIACWLARSAKSFPDQIALVQGTGTAIFYREFASSAASLAGALLNKLGCLPGDPGARVAVLAGNCPAYLEALYAIWWAGCIAVPINAK